MAKIITVLAIALIVVSAGIAGAAFTAYNDCSGTSGGNTTSYGLEACQGTGMNTGLLKDYASGTNTSVTVTAATTSDSPGSYPQGTTPPGASDAGTVFNGIVNLVGVQQYGGNSGWYYTLTFSGLNANARYEFVTTAIRSNTGYTTRLTKYSVSGADSFTNSSTLGTTIADAGASTTFCTGDNSTLGYVARWTQIASGSDGIVTFRAESGGTINQAYGFSAFMLKETNVPEPGSLVALGSGLMGLAGFAIRRRRS